MDAFRMMAISASAGSGGVRLFTASAVVILNNLHFGLEQKQGYYVFTARFEAGGEIIN